MSKDKKTSEISLYEARIEELRINKNNNLTKALTRHGWIEVPIFEKAKDGGILINYWNIEKELIEYLPAGIDPSNDISLAYRDKMKPYQTHRLNYPMNGAKYINPKGQNTHPWIPPFITDELYPNDVKTKTCVLTEGAFKAWVGSLFKLPVFGLVSTTVYKDKETGEIYEDIKKFIHKCGVETVIILFDGDTVTNREKDIIEGKDLAFRLNNFKKQILKLRELLKDLNVEIYFSYIKSSELEYNPKGLDDLLNAYRGQENEITDSLLSFSKPSKYFEKVNITHDLQELYKIYPTKYIQQFTKKFREQLAGRTFKFNNKNYSLNEDGNIINIETGSALYELDIIDTVTDIDEFNSENQFFIQNSRICVMQESKGKGKRKPIDVSDFTFSFIYKIETFTKNNIRLCVFQRKINNKIERKLIEISADELNKSKFVTILRSEGLTLYQTSEYFLNILFQYNFNNERKAIQISKYLGYQCKYDIYAFSNGILNSQGKFIPCNQLGIVQDCGNFYYIPINSITNIDNKEYKNIRSFSFKEGTISFKEFTTKLKVAAGDNGVFILLYFFLGFYRDLLFEIKGRFPYLFLFGTEGSGKSAHIELLMNLWGGTYGEISMISNEKAIARHFDKIINHMVYAKEFDPNDVSPFILGLLKAGYEGVNYSIGTTSTDNSTKDFAINSCVVFDGNKLPDIKSELQSRFWILFYENQNFTDEQKDAFTYLKDKVKKDGLGHILATLFGKRNECDEFFKTNFYENQKYFKDANIKERSQEICTFYITILQFIKTVYPDNELPEENYFIEKLISLAETQEELISDIRPDNVFWSSLEWYVNTKAEPNIKSKISFFYVDEDCEQIFIKWNRAYSIYKEYCRLHEIRPDSKSTLRTYLTQKKYFIPGIQESRKGKTTIIDGFGSAYVFSYEARNGLIYIGNNNYNLIL